MQLSGPAMALGLSRGDALALALGEHRLRCRDRGRGARREGLEQHCVVPREGGSILEAIDDHQHAVAVAAKDQRHHEAALGLHAHATEPVLLEAHDG